VPTTEAERTTRNGRAHGIAEGLAEGLAESFEGFVTIARTQAEESFKQGEKAELVLKDQSIASIKAAEAIGLSVLSAMADITAPLVPKLPSVVPVSNLETLVKAGFEITQQLLSTERTLAEAATRMIIRQV
jgi:flagellar biosynthesis/type III secretory pathway protein FliH